MGITFDPTTIASIGEIPITVVNPAPGGESAPQTLTLYQQIVNAGVIIVSVPTTGKLYLASNSGYSSLRPNTVVPVDPTTGTIGTPIAVGKDPSLMAASTDGAYLFIVNRSDSTIQRIALATNAVDRTYPFPPNIFCPTCTAPSVTAIQPVPGVPTQFVIAQDSYLSLYDDPGLINELSTPTYGSLSTDYLTFAGAPAHLYSAPFSSSDNFFKQFTIDATGVHPLTTTGTAPTVPNELDHSLASIGTQIFTDTGHVWDAGSKQLLATIPVGIININSGFASVAADPNQKQVYYGGELQSASSVSITAYDTTTYAPKTSLAFTDTNLLYTTNLSRWGKDGFAFIDHNADLVLFRSSVLAGTSLLAPAITFTVPDHNYGDAAFAVNATSNSTGTITYSVLSGQATLSGNAVTITGIGAVTLQAIQSADGNYAEAEVSATFNVTPTPPVLTFTVANHTYGDAALMLSASSTSPAAIAYTVVSGPASISGNTLSINGAGVVQVQASQPASGNDAAATQTATFQVSTAPLTLSANNASRIYGTPNPTFSGVIVGTKNNDTLSENFTTAATQNSPVAVYSIVPSISGAAAGNYTVIATNGTCTVTQAAAGVSLTPSSTSVTPGQSATVTIAVTSSTTGTPTGVVTLQDNGASVATLALTNGGTTYSAILPSGITHHFSATYPGDANFTAATTTTTTSVVVSGTDNAFISSTSTQQAVAGSAVVYTLQLNPGAGSYPAPVTFSAQGLPSGFVASFSPSMVNVGTTQQTVQMTLQAPAIKAQVDIPPSRLIGGSLTFTLAFAVLPLVGLRRSRLLRNTTRNSLAFVCAMAFGLLSVTGCASNPPTATQPQTQTYTITVTAISGTVQHQTTVTLVW
ncbi:hypothetical protein AciX9_0212 [Granulicella tundricola MP5ACTX9]|uniref:Bacterial Ig-like domain-containing protein n=1 Tax=Granulicella tundricola (strain ATCC BAA-1859 / DSM 23138 / MP5ACTX9) TaxID=1198114 RepID=E8WVB1_GRATM|nr:hypothetical protein AciX9_0212 [Granulicella tundricola MP5ACTX9]